MYITELPLSAAALHLRLSPCVISLYVKVKKEPVPQHPVQTGIKTYYKVAREDHSAVWPGHGFGRENCVHLRCIHPRCTSPCSHPPCDHLNTHPDSNNYTNQHL